MKGTNSVTSAGEMRYDSTPQAVADVILRRSSSMRSGARATSIPPETVINPIARYWSVESTVSRVISLEWSTGKQKLEAWPVEPPGLGRGPLSIWTMSFHPISAKCPTTEFSCNSCSDDYHIGAGGEVHIVTPYSWVQVRILRRRLCLREWVDVV